MEYVTLGQSDMKISVITHGCMELGGGFGGRYWEVKDKKDNIRLLQTALDSGINIFDTAEVYGDGNSESIVGEALKDHRHRCLIATKVSPEHLREKDVRTSVENSLKRLGTDTIDLLYIHWPNQDVPLCETLSAFEQMKKEGMIRGIGVSNFDLPKLKEAASIVQIDAFQMEYHLLEWEGKEEILDFCKDKRISVFTYNSMAKGILTGAFHLGQTTLSPNDFRRTNPLFFDENLQEERKLILLLQEIAKEYSVSISQVSLAFLLQDVRISSAIVGTQNEQHFLDNIAAVKLRLPSERINQLRRMSQAVISNLQT